jgi:hypothetical protein
MILAVLGFASLVASVICTTMRVDAESNRLTRVDEGG